MARPDGREANQLRPVQLEIGAAKHAEGSCLIRMGETTVLCTASVEDGVPPFLRGTGEGWVTGEVPRLAAQRYLHPLVEADVDTIVLGCTHYPLLNETIHDAAAELLGHDVVVVDSAEATASALSEMQATGDRGAGGSLRILVTDLPGQFAASASRFLGKPVQGLDIQAIDL